MPNPHIVIDTNEIRMTDDDGAPALHILRPSYLSGEEYYWFPLTRTQKNRQAVNNSTVLVDSELIVPVRAGSVVSIDAIVTFAQPDYVAQTCVEKWQVAAPTGSSGTITFVRAFASRNAVDTSADAGTYDVAEVITTSSAIGQFGEQKMFQIRGHVIVGGADGDIKIQFAQNSAVSANIWLMEGSWLRVQRIA